MCVMAPDPDRRNLPSIYPMDIVMNRLAFSILLATAVPAAASAAPDTGTQPTWTFDWNARLRYEQVDDRAFAHDARAGSLRLRAGVEAALPRGFAARVEGEAIAVDDARANNGANGRVAYPGIGDADGNEINQAWLRWSDGPTSVTAGRQRFALDNHRWIGSSAWRQNEQTFDALAVSVDPATPLKLKYAWLDRVHRTAGDRATDRLARERDLDSHVLNLAWSRSAQAVVAYGLWHRDEDVAAMSTRTAGLRYTLAPVKEVRAWGVALEGAHQSDHGANPLRFSHRYWLVEPSVAFGPVTLRAGWEHLGGDGRHALQTPLATLHAFNGWADRFTVTPAAGLDDRYVGLSGAVRAPRGAGPLEWTAVWHDYRADTGGVRYGDELDVSVALPVTKSVRALAKVAHYRADAYSRDATKFWLQLEWSGRRSR